MFPYFVRYPRSFWFLFQAADDAAAAMDTQEGKPSFLPTTSPRWSFFLDHASSNKVVKNSVPTTVRIPYSLVPSIDFNSVAYQRALSTLGKQILNDKPKDKHKVHDKKQVSDVVANDHHNDTSHEFVTCSGSSNNDDVSSMDLGVFSHFSFSFLFTDSWFHFFLDKVAPALQSVPAITNDDHNVIKRATDIVADDTMIDLVDETEGSDNYIKDALRLQIVQGCQFLRSYLTSVNLLMKKYNAIKPVTASSSKI